jgi:serine/threonine protein kinase
MGGGSSTVVKNRQDMVLDSALSGSVPILQADDFEIKDLLQIGGMGRVYSGLRKSDNKPIALKFFGYTKRTQSEREILREINLMQALVGINGVVQLLGVFFDTSEGLIPGKLSFEKFPVVVMELLAGGDLLEKIFENQVVSEKRLAAMFKGIILALKQIHERGFIHRDLKLENLMYADETNADIKIIDFGMMVQLKEGQDVYMSDGLQGTPGYLAPESIKNNEYSAATDMWQAGCCLYSILSGQMPFDDDFNQVTKGSYHKMSGTGWDNISRQAKNLVANILRKEKSERFGADDILKHPWIESAAPAENLSKDYYSRIKTLVLRRKLRKVFLEHNIEESNKLRRQSLVKALHRSGTSFRSNDTAVRDDSEVDRGDVPQDAVLESTDPNFGAKLYTLKRLVLAKLNPQYVDAGADKERTVAGADADSSGVISLPPQKESLSVSPGTSFAEEPGATAASVELNYEEFTEILISAGLTDLASAHVFNIFDIGGSGIPSCDSCIFVFFAD